MKKTHRNFIFAPFASVMILLLAVVIQLGSSVAHAQSPPVRYDDLPDAAEFTLSGRKWNRTNLTYYFQNGTGDIPGNDEHHAVREAFRFWSNATNLTFTEVGSPSQADIAILWATGSHGDGSSFDGTNGVLAHAFFPPANGTSRGTIEGDAHFDDDEFWTYAVRNDPSQPIDLVTVAAHEIGHSLGLGHSQFADALMAPFYNGSHRYLSQDDVDGIRALYPPLPVPQKIEPTDYDADGRAEFTVFTPANGVWQRATTDGALFPGVQFGQVGDIPVGGDYDGDRRADLTVYRPSEGMWYILPSTTGSFYGVGFGLSGDIPVPGDYDRDGRTDVAVFRPSDRNWYILPSSTGQFYSVNFGFSDDKPVPGDYDYDGKTDIAVYRPSNGYWYIMPSSRGGFYGIQFGLPEDKPAPGDYDGDGKTDLAVFRPSVGDWYILFSANNQFYATHFGLSEDIPVASDFDGDRRTDIAVWRPSDRKWYVLKSTGGIIYGFQLGMQGDIPVSATLAY